MTPHFIRQLIVHTICNVTGEPPEAVSVLDKIELDTRDWEQVFSRLEATLDVQTGLLTSAERSICIDALTAQIHAGLTGDIVS